MMHTLKELRNQLGVTQSEVAQKISVSVPAYSTYENGQAVPCVEDMILLEREFGQKIEWNDTINIEDKAEIMEALTSLAESYPLSAVLIFAQRNLKEGIRNGKPGKIITFYANEADKLNIQALEPTGVKFKNK